MENNLEVVRFYSAVAHKYYFNTKRCSLRVFFIPEVDLHNDVLLRMSDKLNCFDSNSKQTYLQMTTSSNEKLINTQMNWNVTAKFYSSSVNR